MHLDMVLQTALDGAFFLVMAYLVGIFQNGSTRFYVVYCKRGQHLTGFSCAQSLWPAVYPL